MDCLGAVCVCVCVCVCVSHPLPHVLGAPAIVKATMLTDRVHCMTATADGTVQRWNVMRGVVEETLGVVDFAAQVGI